MTVDISQLWGPPCVAFAATCENGVPKATSAAAAWAAVWLGYTAAVQHAVSNWPRAARSSAAGRPRGADAGQVLLERARRGDELHVLVDERCGQGAQRPPRRQGCPVTLQV